MAIGLFAAGASGQVIISEIMYNPASSEGRPMQQEPNLVEYVEIYNAGSEAVKIEGWFLKDEDGNTGPIAAGAVLAPGKAAVLIPAEQTVEGFRAAWGQGHDVHRLEGWGSKGLSYLANNPSPTNERLTLRNGDKAIVDEVNYDDEDGWPGDEPNGASIYVKPGSLDAKANDEGKNWARSEEGILGAAKSKSAGAFNGTDVGSPGSVATQ